MADVLRAEFNKTISKEEKQKINAYLQWRDLAAQLSKSPFEDVGRALATQFKPVIDMQFVDEVIKKQLTFQEGFKKAIESLHGKRD